MLNSNIKITQPETSCIINPNLYGQFAEHLGHCIYEGLWVGEDSSIPNRNGLRTDVVEALKTLKIPVLRWPGGCFADEYHWKDGIGPKEIRKRIYNSHWGGVVETNHFGTHEFFELCSQLETKPYICGNVGSGTVQEMQEWVEYITSPAESPMANWRRENGQEEPWKLDYFGVGNESWGCGGHMRPEYYADEFRRYNTYVRTYGTHKIFRIACGANTTDYNWTRILMDRARDHMDGLSLHNYTLLNNQWPPSGSAIEFGKAEYYSILKAAAAMDPLITEHSKVMDEFDPDAKVGLIVDEWGTWYPVEPGTNPGFLYQQNTMRDALVAAIHFNIFHKHAKRVQMTNIAQMVNVLQAMILTKGPDMVLTPTYWVFEMYKPHQGAELLELQIETDLVEELAAVTATASIKDGLTTVSLANLSIDEDAKVSIKVSGFGTKVSGRILASSEANDHNSFEQPEKIKPVAFSDYKFENETLELVLPPSSIVCLSVTK